MDTPSLSRYVLNALDFIEENNNFSISLPESKRTLVTGSQSGYYTGRILYKSAGRVFSHAEEVQAIDVMRRELSDLGDMTIVSATGSRQVVGVGRAALENGLDLNVITCNPNSEIRKALGDDFKEILVPSLDVPEARTINTATYGMMIYGITHESISDIRSSIRAYRNPENGYSGFGRISFNVSDKHLEVGRMVGWKMQEIFGRSIGHIGTNYTNHLHGAPVRLGKDELYIGLGISHEQIDRLRSTPIPMEQRHVYAPENELGALGTLLLSYYIIGQIQEEIDPDGFQKGLLTY